MNIQYWSLAESAGLARFYNIHTAGIPGCFPVSEQEFVQGICEKPKPVYPYRSLELEKETLIVGMVQETIAGFAQVGRLKKVTVSGECSTSTGLRFFTCLPSQQIIGKAILQEVERYCRTLNINIIEFCDPASYVFYCLNTKSLSARMLHVLGLLGDSSYEIRQKYFFMQRLLSGVTLPLPKLFDASLDVEVVEKAGSGDLPDLQVNIWCDSQRVGFCNTSSVGTFCRDKTAQESAYTTWIKVEAEWRKQGIARYLLQRTQLELQKIGYKHLYTDVRHNNYPAQLLHAQVGYQVVDSKYTAIMEFTL